MVYLKYYGWRWAALHRPDRDAGAGCSGIGLRNELGTIPILHKVVSCIYSCTVHFDQSLCSAHAPHRSRGYRTQERRKPHSGLPCAKNRNSPQNPIKSQKSLEIIYGLRNFIGNANKFSKKKVEIFLNSNKDITEVTIKDDGPGFPKDLIDKQKMGGEPLAVELWGKRKLSHYIDKQKYGTYVLLQFNGEGKCTGDCFYG